MDRYIKNMKALSLDEIKKLSACKVCVAGCGGLGGYVIEILGRIGVGHITAVDGDIFDESNLNRQILSDIYSLGKSKALKARERMESINPLIKVVPINEKIDRNNCFQLLSGHDVIVDALDNAESRLLLQDTASDLKIPLVHGAIAGWFGQITTIFPGDKSLSKIYSSQKMSGIEKELGNPPFTPALTASIQAGEVIKVLINRGDVLRKKMLVINLLENRYEILDL